LPKTTNKPIIEIMNTSTRIRMSLLIALITCCPSLPIRAATPISIETPNLLLRVDADNCRWSAEVKGTPMQLNDVHFLPVDDVSGWTVTSSVKNDDSNSFGSFVTVTLRGTKPGQLDFEYQISASRTGNDILLSLGRSNNTGKAVDIGDLDYFVSSDARLGSTCDRWIALGTQSRNRDLYELAAVINLISPKTYAVNHVVRDSDTGNSLLLGHVTTLKGASRFAVASGWQGKSSRPDAGSRILQLQSHRACRQELSRGEVADRFQSRCSPGDGAPGGLDRDRA
jgi:hypothetical protein